MLRVSSIVLRQHSLCAGFAADEDDPETLSEKARVQILRAIGVAIVKHGSMFPTMEILLRHAVNYLNMKKSKAVSSSGVIDDEDGMIDDFASISLDECRAVLCTHMLCYVLDGSIGFSELELWKRMTDRVEELYQIGTVYIYLDRLRLPRLLSMLSIVTLLPYLICACMYVCACVVLLQSAPNLISSTRHLCAILSSRKHPTSKLPSTVFQPVMKNSIQTR